MPGHLPGALSPISAVARALWFLAWSVLAGAAAWARLFPGGRRLAPGTDEVVGRLWRRAMRLGWLWTAQATVLSLLVLLVAAVTSANSLPVTRETGIGWALLAAALVQLRRVTRRATAAQEPVEPRDRSALAWLTAALAVGEVLTLPTRTRAPEALRAVVASTHLASAGLWLGVLALLIALVRTRPRGDAGPLARVARPVVETACRAAAVAVLSGLAAAAISSPGLGHWADEYSALLAAKAVVLVLAAAIAWRQWNAVHARRPVARIGSAFVVEAGALLAAGALAAVLVGVDPLGAVNSAAAPAHTVVATAASVPSCVTGHTDCDAATINAVVSGTPDSGLDAAVPGLCTADPAKPHAYTYFTCLETVGQALAVKASGAPGSLDHCRPFPGVWAQQSCAAGIFSALVAHEMTGAPSADPNQADPMWPCRDVPDDAAPPCYLLAATRVLWLNGGDLHATFVTCSQQTVTWQGYCFQGTGREIATRAGYDPPEILQECGAAGALGPGPCLVGAARTLVFTGHASAAKALCDAAGPVTGPACERERLAALTTL